MRRITTAECILALLLLPGLSSAQALHKYKGPNGDWVYTDRAPEKSQAAEVRALPTGQRPASVSVTTSQTGRTIRFEARNEYVIPVEVVLALDELSGLEAPEPGQRLHWVVDAGSTRTLLELDAMQDNLTPSAAFRYAWLPGDPEAKHADHELYRAPFTIAGSYDITQAYPTGITHVTPDSYYAVDFAMPIGTDVFAARAGVVFDVASTNFQGGFDDEQYLKAANIVRIMHDDGSHAVYAHLNWNSIRVRPGDRVARGEYIADSGNTGFTTGPHLHFAVLINRGLRLVSVPVVFAGQNATPIVPETGATLVAY